MACISSKEEHNVGVCLPPGSNKCLAAATMGSLLYLVLQLITPACAPLSFPVCQPHPSPPVCCMRMQHHMFTLWQASLSWLAIRVSRRPPFAVLPYATEGVVVALAAFSLHKTQRELLAFHWYAARCRGSLPMVGLARGLAGLVCVTCRQGCRRLRGVLACIGGSPRLLRVMPGCQFTINGVVGAASCDANCPLWYGGQALWWWQLPTLVLGGGGAAEAVLPTAHFVLGGGSCGGNCLSRLADGWVCWICSMSSSSTLEHPAIRW